METRHYHNFLKISKAISFIEDHKAEHPNLNQIAEHVSLSPTHFQKLFKDWAGVSPHQFLQYLNISYAKSILKENTLAETTFQSGLSSTGRLHDLFINIEGMTPGEFKNEGEFLSISYYHYPTLFGIATIANTTKGICYVGFHDDEDHGKKELIQLFPKANFSFKKNSIHSSVLQFINNKYKGDSISLHIKGTGFQIKIWEALLKIPTGKFTTYGSLANFVNQPKASRAVGSAVGKNPIALLIPCHRVIQSTGEFGQYRWNKVRKQLLLGKEAIQKEA